ncbi:hypothetical protein Y032_0516g2794 [Ancylostoma ceylanicum]|uniref:Uncharacterized protein n=1 Tax=Ancylostoma ceylanicum TaxID=53326 RepID=A0A016WSK2_9BILA|nr:hypothetical protein Y032_0516g2794 [Ancylostoma ceylanicum]
MSNTSAQCTLLRQSESSNVEAAPITREYLTLLSQNYENGSYAFCGGRIHVALLTKIISIGVIPFYALILTFMVHFGNATAIMFAIIILGSVAVTTIYGAFRGSKLCLVPFIFLQVVFFIYDLVLLGLFSIALLRSEKSASLVYTIYVTDSVSPQIGTFDFACTSLPKPFNLFDFSSAGNIYRSVMCPCANIMDSLRRLP